MIKDNIKMIPIATYSTIYEIERKEKNEIILEIQKYDMRTLLIEISMINNMQDEEVLLRAKYVKNKKFDKIIADKFNGYMLFSKQGLLLLSKWIFAYGVKLEHNYLNSSHYSENIFDLQLLTADYLPADDIYSPLSYLYKNLALNSKRNIKNEISRSHYMFFELSQNRSEYQSSDYIDFNSDYYCKYGHTIEEYNTIVFIIVSLHQGNKSQSAILDCKEFQKKMARPDIFNNIIKDISNDLEAFKNWAVKSIDNSWDFTMFLDFPLIKLDDQYALSINEDYIINLCFEGLFHRIRHVYPSDSTDIITFLGRPFEKYVELLTKNAVKESNNNKYEFIPEFKYGKGNGSDSSDSYIKIENTLIIIEAKSKRPLFTTLFTDDDTKIIEGIKKVYSEPVVQAFDAFNNIMKSNKSYLFEKIQNIYIISVSLMGIPRISEAQKIVDAHIGDKLGEMVLGSINLNIEEFEYFCGLIGQGIDPLNLLNKYCKEHYYSPFINFVHSEFPYNKNSNLIWLSQNFINFTHNASKILFNSDLLDSPSMK